MFDVGRLSRYISIECEKEWEGYNLHIKWIFSGLLILAILLILPAGEAEARLSVASPQGMIEWADIAFYQVHRPAENMEESGLITKEQMAAMIKAQGCHDMEYYYLDGLSCETANLDDDADREILARIDGGVHLCQFFIFDKDPNGKYKLIAERDWKVEEWDLNHPADIDGKMVFRLITRDGGTGVDIYTTHLFYLHQNHFTEAWQGTMLERSVFGGAYFQKVCGYQVDLYNDNKRLYTWETTLDYQLEADGVTPSGDVKTETLTRVYIFNGTEFVQQESE